MLLPDPINNPGAPGFSSSELISVQPVLQDWMPNNKSLSVSSGAHYWEIVLHYSDMLTSEYNILAQQIDKTLQLNQKLEVWLPQYEDYTIKLSDYSIKSHSTNQVTLKQQGLISFPKPGMLIQFSNHTKVYRITGFSIQGDSLTIEFFPSLRVSLPQGTQIKFTGIRFTTDFKDRSNPLPAPTYNQDGFYSEGATLELREAI